MYRTVNVAAPAPESSPRQKELPQRKKIPVPYEYVGSDDGTDENLLILLHGLGENRIST
jgi:hypothetical protein